MIQGYRLQTHFGARMTAWRSGFQNTFHEISAVVTDARGNPAGPALETPCLPQGEQTLLRSLAKPFQALPLYWALNPSQMPPAIRTWMTQNTPELRLRSPGDKPLLKLSSQDWAILCASHWGNPDQVALLKGIAEKARAIDSSLPSRIEKAFVFKVSPASDYPLNIQAKLALAQTAGEDDANPLASPWLHQCAGNHLAMMLASECLGYPLEGRDGVGYDKPGHPVQRLIAHILSYYTEAGPFPVGRDGCGVPTFQLPLTRVAQLYAQLVSNSDLKPIAEAMAKHPATIAQSDQVDSLAMTKSKSGGQAQPRLLAKTGAEGLVAVGNFATGQGLVVRNWTGADERSANNIAGIAAVDLLRQQGWLTPQTVEAIYDKSKRLNWEYPQYATVYTVPKWNSLA